MPFFAADNFDVKCKINDNLGVPVIGGAVEGQLTIYCAEPTKIRGLVLRYRVFRTTHKVVGTSVNHLRHVLLNDPQANRIADMRLEGGFLIPTTSGHRSEFEEEDHKCCRKTYEAEVVLVGSRHGASMDIPVGTYTYPFRIPLPSSLSPSENLRVVGGATARVALSFIFGCRHELGATVIIANGVKDYTKSWGLRTHNGVHPMLHRSQQPDTKFQDSPTFIGAACCPQLALWFPGPLRADRSTFCLQVMNPIIALDRDHSGIKCKLQATRDMSTRPVFIHLIRRVRFGLAPGTQTHKTLCALRLELPLPSTTADGNDDDDDDDLSGGRICHDLSFNLSLVKLGLMTQDQARHHDGTLRGPIMAAPTGPATICSVEYSISYYLVCRQDHSQDEYQCCQQNGVIPRDEAQIPILVFHTVSDEVPIGPHRMHWLPSISTVHAAPQWSATETERRRRDAGGAGGSNSGNPTTANNSSNSRSSGVEPQSTSSTRSSGSSEAVSNSPTGTHSNPVTIVGSYAQRNLAVSPGNSSSGGPRSNASYTTGARSNEGIVMASNSPSANLDEPAQGVVMTEISEIAPQYIRTWRSVPPRPGDRME